MLPSISVSSLLDSLNSLNAGGMMFNLGKFGVQLPTLEMFSSIVEPVYGFGDFTASAGSIVQLMTSGARGIYCIGAIIADGDFLLKTIKMVGQYVALLGLEMINEIYQNCVARVNSLLANVYGIVLSYYRTIKHLINTIRNLKELFTNLQLEKKNIFKNIIDKIFKKENCEYFVANLLRCLIAKYIEPYLQKFTDKVNQKIDDIAGDIYDSTNMVTATTTAMSNYLDNQATFVDKFNEQVKYFSL